MYDYSSEPTGEGEEGSVWLDKRRRCRSSRPIIDGKSQQESQRLNNHPHLGAPEFVWGRKHACVPGTSTTLTVKRHRHLDRTSEQPGKQLLLGSRVQHWCLLARVLARVHVGSDIKPDCSEAELNGSLEWATLQSKAHFISTDEQNVLNSGTYPPGRQMAPQGPRLSARVTSSRAKGRAAAH